MTGVMLAAWLSFTSLVAEAGNDPDRLYAYRQHLPSALEAAALWSERLAYGAGDLEAAWKLARACYSPITVVDMALCRWILQDSRPAAQTFTGARSRGRMRVRRSRRGRDGVPSNVLFS